MQTYCLQVETTIHLDFSLFTFHFSLFTFHFCKTHYVAIVPADLESYALLILFNVIQLTIIDEAHALRLVMFRLICNRPELSIRIS